MECVTLRHKECGKEYYYWTVDLSYYLKDYMSGRGELLCTRCLKFDNIQGFILVEDEDKLP